MSYRSLRECEAPEVFYLRALEYAHFLWMDGHAGRSLLALTRALYTELESDCEVLETWPLPYAAFHWIVSAHSSDDFPGNPRVSFQHQATRIRGPREELLRARAWGVWALVRAAKPSLPPDASQGITEPSLNVIERKLATYASIREAELWRAASR